jgi:hypothetical protein
MIPYPTSGHSDYPDCLLLLMLSHRLRPGTGTQAKDCAGTPFAQLAGDLHLE